MLRKARKRGYPESHGNGLLGLPNIYPSACSFKDHWRGVGALDGLAGRQSGLTLQNLKICSCCASTCSETPVAIVLHISINLCSLRF